MNFTAINSTPSILPSAISTPAWWRGLARGKPPSWWSTSDAWWRRGWTRCASWPSPSPRRPRATCGRSWREEFQDDPEIRGRLERAWVSTVHGFCARLLRENAVFAGVDPEFRIVEGNEAWRMQQESIAAAIDALFQEHPARLRALIRGLSSFEFEEAVLSAYDTMRGAGVRVEDLAGFASSARRHHRRDRRHDERAARRAGDGLERRAAPAPGLDSGRRGAHCDGGRAARSVARDRRAFPPT